MALTKDQIRATYPLPVYNYRVEIDSAPVAFSEVSGLSLAYETHTYAESSLDGKGVIRRHMPGQLKAANITLKKGVVSGLSVGILFDWINSIQLNRVQKKDIHVRLCDENGSAVVSWLAKNAFPIKLDAPTFTASSNEVAIESMELMADSVMVEQS